MKDRINISSTQRGIRRVKKALNDPKVRQEIAKAGAGPLLKSLDLVTPVGDKDQRRYAKRRQKGKRNRPSVITHTTRKGNLKSSLVTVPTAQGVSVGPRMSPGGGDYAIYAAAVHSRDPYLVKAMKRSQASGQQIMSNRVKRLIQRLDV